MKKLLILILIALLLILSIFIALHGVEAGSVTILGVKGIQDKSEALDKKIQEAGKLAEKTYTQAVSDVNENAKKLEQEKKNYEDMTTVSTDGEEQASNQLGEYEIETLWVRLGNHATAQGVEMQMDVLPSTSGAQGTYNLRFTATGSYISITDFISAIENDSTLGFKIEEFKMVPSGSSLQGTFVCKDIAIKEVSSTTSTDTNTNNTANTSGTNTANATNTTNSTNMSNTSNNSSNVTNVAQ